MVAILLSSMGEPDLTRETLVTLAQNPALAPNDRLWLASDLVELDCDELAYQQLVLAEQGGGLAADDRDLLQELRCNYFNY